MEQFLISIGLKFQEFLIWLSNPITQLLFLPLLGCVFIMATPKHRTKLIKTWALVFSGLSTLAAVFMLTGLPEAWRRLGLFASGDFAWQPFGQYVAFRPGMALQFTQQFEWLKIQLGDIQSFGVQYFVGLDGLSLPLVLMSSLIIFSSIIWALHRKERVRDYFALVLVLQTGLLGVFAALDYVLFFLFWELMLIPMYLLISGWGPRRAEAGRAAIKFFIYTIFGSVFMLIAFIALQVLSTEFTFSIPALSTFHLQEGTVLPALWRTLIFIGLLLGFAVKVPMFPFHTWLPDAHTEAPTEMSVILAAVMLKTGSYAFLRVLYPTLPDIGYSLGPVLAFCGVAAIVYGAAITLVQTDLKRMVAYSSISHMGFIVLGMSVMNPDATVGAVYHMVAHGVIIATLFYLTGVVERRYGTRDMHELAGMMKGAPAYAITLGIAAFAGMGLPGLAGFWGEFMVLKGTFYNNPNWTTVQVGPVDASRFLQIMAVLAVIGILTAAVYMINMLQKVVPGEWKHEGEPWRGFRLTDGIVLVPLTAAIILMGLWPQPLINMCTDYAINLWSTALRF
jgi:NADH-quinone oxidoreductase subunit M